MSSTVPILQDITARIQKALPELEVRLFPDRPSEYRFIHPVGAVLVQYQGSRFDNHRSLDVIVQQRAIQVHLTIFSRSLHHDWGALNMLDRIRLTILGFAPVDCSPIHMLSEAFLDETAGAWQYEMRLQTETQEVEQKTVQDLPHLTKVYVREESKPLHPDLKPK